MTNWSVEICEHSTFLYMSAISYCKLSHDHLRQLLGSLERNLNENRENEFLIHRMQKFYMRKQFPVSLPPSFASFYSRRNRRITFKCHIQALLLVALSLVLKMTSLRSFLICDPTPLIFASLM
jgi:hypothetical protein